MIEFENLNIIYVIEANRVHLNRFGVPVEIDQDLAVGILADHGAADHEDLEVLAVVERILDVHSFVVDGLVEQAEVAVTVYALNDHSAGLVRQETRVGH